MALGFTGFLAGEHLPELLRRFNERYPHVEVTAVTRTSSELEEETLDGRLDFYIGSTFRQNGEMTGIPIMDVRLEVVVRDHVLKQYTDFTDERIAKAEREGISLSEIQNVPLIIPERAGGRVREHIERYLKTNRINAKLVLEAHHTIIASSCQKGIGAGILYSVTSVDDGNAEDRMHRFPIRDMDYTIYICICYRKDHFLTSYEEDFIRLTREYFRSITSGE